MALEIVQNAPSPQRGRQADVDLELVTEASEMVQNASRSNPLSDGKTFKTKKEAEAAGRKLAKQVDRFRDDANSTVGTRAFVQSKDPGAWNEEDDKWQWGIYLTQPRKRRT